LKYYCFTPPTNPIGPISLIFIQALVSACETCLSMSICREDELVTNINVRLSPIAFRN
jgi:hypothetical protein